MSKTDTKNRFIQNFIPYQTTFDLLGKNPFGVEIHDFRFSPYKSPERKEIIDSKREKKNESKYS